jgi:hypothetical protein
LIEEACTRVAIDRGASPSLGAVMAEFRNKGYKAAGFAERNEGPLHDAIIELEQAGHSARIAALADMRINPSTRTAVLDAHDAVNSLKRALFDFEDLETRERSPRQENL